jgi:hypothetical protein
LRRIPLLVVALAAALAVAAAPAHAKPNTRDTTITSRPAASTFATAATFSFTSTITPASFSCSLDSGA